MNVAELTSLNLQNQPDLTDDTLRVVRCHWICPSLGRDHTRSFASCVMCCTLGVYPHIQPRKPANHCYNSNNLMPCSAVVHCTCFVSPGCQLHVVWSPGLVTWHSLLCPKLHSPLGIVCGTVCADSTCWLAVRNQVEQAAAVAPV